MFIKTMSGDALVNPDNAIAFNEAKVREVDREEFEKSDNFPKGCNYVVAVTLCNGGQCYILGGYETEERAKEVLCEIESCLMKPWYIEETSSNRSSRYTRHEKIYQVPKE